MAREKKDHKNFTCKMSSNIYLMLEEYSAISGMSKTIIVERAIERYVNENIDAMKELTRNTDPLHEKAQQ